MAATRELVRGALISVCYCLAFLSLWYCSIDQWYLPVGLRVVALLFRPYREWPFLLAGDAAAMLWLRVPLSHNQGYDPAWGYLSPFLHAPMIALGIWSARRYCGKLIQQTPFLIPFSIAIAFFNSSWSIVLNASLDGPSTADAGQFLVRYWLGSYQGILAFLLPVLLWSPQRRGPTRADLPRDLALSVVVILVLFYILGYTQGIWTRKVLMALLIGPAIFLTRNHGWTGTALGTLLANLALAITLPKTYEIGYYNAQLFDVQIFHVIVSAILFSAGAKFVKPVKRFETIRRVRVDAQRAIQESYLSAERTLRNRVVEYSDINVQVNRMRKSVIADLRARGQHAAAMEITRLAVLESQLLHEYVGALYPLEIETHGLFRSLRSAAFERLNATEVTCLLQGDCQLLSLGLQLAAYRCVLNTMELLPVADKHFIHARVWRGRGAQGVLMRVFADTSVVDSLRRESPDAEAELRARLKAHGGMFRRRHALVVSFLVAEVPTVTATETPSSVPRWLAARLAQ
ncbi:MASE1 domain-containing protein [Xanthomonas euvesicatoria]|uniref:MASE1 domain-containing protein n=1 Tax=Xanthomonas euvesicatoria TaxID=456327 RepID=UPI001C48F5E8|nr:MASE1 domain-containing protein [Xanthomonas euvesicatoria]MBV6864778.1 MASE1 domain-containing protein [Xanthomonas campestris pv. coriandri]MCE4327020.1 MASE1 domain-containing protein [Xanthomonas campestris pv. coriandri]